MSITAGARGRIRPGSARDKGGCSLEKLRSKMSKEEIKQHNLEVYGSKIKKYRVGAGLSAEALAERLHVSLGTVRNWECGLARPDPDLLAEMFSILAVAPNDFFALPGMGPLLTKAEKNVLSLFRSLDGRGREDYLALGEALSGRCHRRRLTEVKEKILSLPDYGRFASAGAGDGWSGDAEAEQVLLYNAPPVSQADEIITVSGRSMEPNFHDHDRILVQHCREAVLGEVYVFSLRGLGLVVKEAAADRLHSRNEAYADIIPWEEEGAELIGRVLGVIDASMIPSKEDLRLYKEAEEALRER